MDRQNMSNGEAFWVLYSEPGTALEEIYCGDGHPWVYQVVNGELRVAIGRHGIFDRVTEPVALHRDPTVRYRVVEPVSEQPKEPKLPEELSANELDTTHATALSLGACHHELARRILAECDRRYQRKTTITDLEDHE